MWTISTPPRRGSKRRAAQVKMGPMEVPGGQWVLQGQDPQGAYFALVAPKR